MLYKLRTELRRSNASGTHQDKRTRRLRTREKDQSRAIKDSQDV